MLIERLWEIIENYAGRGAHKVRIKIKYESDSRLTDRDVKKMMEELCPGLKCDILSFGLFFFNWKPKYKYTPDMYDLEIKQTEKLVDDNITHLHKLTHEGRRKMFTDLINEIKLKNYIHIVDKDIDTHNKVKMLKEHHKYIRKNYFPLIEKWKVLHCDSYCFELNLN